MIYTHTLKLLFGSQLRKHTDIHLTPLTNAVRFVFYSAEGWSSEVQPCLGWARVAVRAHRRTSVLCKGEALGAKGGCTIAPFQSTPKKTGCATVCGCVRLFSVTSVQSGNDLFARAGNWWKRQFQTFRLGFRKEVQENMFPPASSTLLKGQVL